MQKHVNLVDLVKSFPTNIYLQNLASIQKRTSRVKFAHFAEKSVKGSISNLSTKVLWRDGGPQPLPAQLRRHLPRAAADEERQLPEDAGAAQRLHGPLRPQPAQGAADGLVERFDIEPFPDFSVK